jgi:hypothetical protein
MQQLLLVWVVAENQHYRFVAPACPHDGTELPGSKLELCIHGTQSITSGPIFASILHWHRFTVWDRKITSYAWL